MDRWTMVGLIVQQCGEGIDLRLQQAIYLSIHLYDDDRFPPHLIISQSARYIQVSLQIP